jgi:small-conductance mechanosensitive channel
MSAVWEGIFAHKMDAWGKDGHAQAITESNKTLFDLQNFLNQTNKSTQALDEQGNQDLGAILTRLQNMRV